MLCRLLLTAIAISCTFKRETIAQGQGTQRLLQIKDLLCVLILSGVQKEDLDTSMLIKLQRYNVNIDDMNNVELRQECLTKSEHEQARKKSFEEYEEKKTTVKPKIEKSNTDSFVDVFDTADLNTIIKNFIKLNIKEKAGMTDNDGINSNNRPIQTKNFVPATSNKRELYSDIRENLQKPDTEHNFSQPKLNSVMKFWQAFSNINISNRNDDNVDTKQKNKIIITTSRNEMLNIRKISVQNIQSKESEFFNRTPIQIKTNMEKERNEKISSVYRQISKLLNNDLNYDEVKSQPKHLPNAYNYKINSNNDKGESKPKYTLEEETTIPLTRDANNLPYTQDRFNNFPSFNTHVQNSDKQNRKAYDDLPFEKKYEQSLKTFNMKSENDKMLPVEINNKYSLETIKDLAESVKAIILNDLRKEISSTTITFTTAATEPTTTKISNPNENFQDMAKVLEKFVEAFQSFKSTNKNTLVTKNNKIKVTQEIDIKPKHDENVESPSLLSRNVYRINRESQDFTQPFANDYNKVTFDVFGPQDNIAQQQNNIRMIPHKPAQIAPITIQSNLMEVPPLAIPMLKPFGPITQNIIVTTKKPYSQPKNERQRWDYLSEVKIDSDKQRKYDNSHKYQTSNIFNREQEFNKRLRFDFNFITKHTNRNLATNTDRYSNNYSENKKYGIDRYKNSRFDRKRQYNREIPRIHERLERISDWPDSRERMARNEDCCKENMALRQQMPLSNKRISRYDDTHFRNFLQSQQKVNDMLETILASKTSGTSSVVVL